MKQLFKYFVFFSVFFFISGFYRSLTSSINANILYFFFISLNLIGTLMFGKILLTRGENLRFLSSFFILLLSMIFNMLVIDITPFGFTMFLSHVYCIAIFFTFSNSLRSIMTIKTSQNFYNLFSYLLIINSIFIFFEGFVSGYGLANTGTLGRGDGFFSNPNHASLLLIVQYSLFSLWSKFQHIKPIRFTKIVPFIVLLGIFGTFSKGSFVIFMVLFIYQMRSANVFYLIASIIFLIIFLPYFNDLRYFLEFNDLIGRNTLDRVFDVNMFFDSANSRIQVIPFAISEFLNAPIFGNGLGYNYAWEFGYASHNIFLLYAVDLGIIGLLIVLYMFKQLLNNMEFAIPIIVGGFFNHNILSVVEIYILISLFYVIINFDKELNINKELDRI